MKRIGIVYLFTISVISSLSCEISCKQVRAKISFGELVDKITILTIKKERISDPEKLNNVTRELDLLLKLFHEYIGDRDDIALLMEELKITNEILWDVEDELRIKERLKEFGEDFIKLARSVYVTNDKRCALKRSIDSLLDSHIVEEKSYASLTYS
jgi:hypothetical protein